MHGPAFVLQPYLYLLVRHEARRRKDSAVANRPPRTIQQQVVERRSSPHYSKPKIGTKC